jgi:hypothetical protein
MAGSLQRLWGEVAEKSAENTLSTYLQSGITFTELVWTIDQRKMTLITSLLEKDACIWVGFFMAPRWLSRPLRKGENTSIRY